MVSEQFSTSQHMVRRSSWRRSGLKGSPAWRRSAPVRRSVLMITLGLPPYRRASVAAGTAAEGPSGKGRWSSVLRGRCRQRRASDSGDVLAQSLLHRLLGHEADHPGGLAAVLEYDQGWDAEDAVAHRQ